MKVYQAVVDAPGYDLGFMHSNKVFFSQEQAHNSIQELKEAYRSFHDLNDQIELISFLDVMEVGDPENYK